MSRVKVADQPGKLRSRFENAVKVFGSVTRVSGLLLTVISMHILVIRPLVQRVDHLQAELHGIEATLSKVAAEQSHLQSTNDLLSELRSQHDAIAGARATLQQMHKLREQIELESNKIPEAMEAVTRICELPDHLHQSELKRYTTLVKPVPGPYQLLPGSGANSDSREVLPKDASLGEIHERKNRIAAAPMLYISGRGNDSMRR